MGQSRVGEMVLATWASGFAANSSGSSAFLRRGKEGWGDDFAASPARVSTPYDAIIAGQVDNCGDSGHRISEFLKKSGPRTICLSSTMRISLARESLCNCLVTVSLDSEA